MYLLKLGQLEKKQDIHKFTFHHVSIKTLVARHYYKVTISFTFHHVSIKTESGIKY